MVVMGREIRWLASVLLALIWLTGCRPAPAPDPEPGPPIVAAPVTRDAEMPEPRASEVPSVSAEPIQVSPQLAVPAEPVKPRPAPPNPVPIEPEQLDRPLYPLSVAAAPTGELYVADHHLPGIWRVQDGQLSLFFLGQKTFRTPLNAIRCVAVDGQGRVLAGDSATGDVYRFDDQGQPHSLTGRERPLGPITLPYSIAVDAEGNLLVTDQGEGDQRIAKIPAEGGSVELVAEVSTPRGLCVDNQQRVWVISQRRLLRLLPDGTQETIADTGMFQFPHAVVVRDEGAAYVSDGYARTIWKIEPGQAPTAWVQGEPLKNPVGMTLWNDRLVVADPHARALFTIDWEGNVSRLEVSREITRLP
jgi:streptogramin lyase